MTYIDALPGDISTVLLDIGGVLYVDPWQSVLLSPGASGTGLADQLDLDHRDVARAAEELWPSFATRHTEEHEYWRQLGDRLSHVTGRKVEFPPDLVASASDRLLHPLPQAWLILAGVRSVLAAAGGRDIGVITDNTTFWYARQYEELQLEQIVTTSDFVFVSAELGQRKPDHPGLYGLAAESGFFDPRTTLVVDDRQRNLDHARSFGFQVPPEGWLRGR
jgi:HAD superfamily hydrolase (TIGR01509 family)